MRLRALIPAGLLCVLPAAAEAQSYFAARGLGLPVSALDARARALGGIGVGLLGFNPSMINPAEAGAIGRRGVAAALQPSTGSADFGELGGDIGGTRFPMVRILYPLTPRLTLDLGYGSIFEQSWSARLDGVEDIGGETIDVQDLVESVGGLSQVRLGATFAVSPTVSVGAAAGLYTGNLDRRVRRLFPDTLGFQPFDTRFRWEYHGPLAVLGVRADPNPRLRFGAAASFGGTLDMDNVEGGGADAESKLPVRLTVGGSAILSSVLMATVGAEWANAGDEIVFDNAPALADERARDTWRVGVGFEYQGLGSATRSFPLRLGAHFAQLPYFKVGEEPPTEWTASAGIGFRLAGDATSPAALADIGFERGGRAGLASATQPELSESFWRFTFSIALFSR